jgi:pyridoxamine 5'-phosphate oxidase
MRFSEHRRSYTLGGLRRKDLAADPVAQFIGWQEQAIARRVGRPNRLRFGNATA